MKKVEIIINKYTDGYSGYAKGMNGIVVGEGKTCKKALTNIKSAIKFHIETFDNKILR